jgi:prepilin-type processing-associated H-X9-DG protein
MAEPGDQFGSARAAWRLEEWLTRPGQLPDPDFRAGSYGANVWLFCSFWNSQELAGAGQFRAEYFRSESEVSQEALTPVLLDCTAVTIAPSATDLPPSDLFYGSRRMESAGMHRIVPRHGSRPASLPKRWPATQKLPGAVNVAFLDGHSEQIAMERLWYLKWHNEYRAPVKRPGLP